MGARGHINAEFLAALPPEGGGQVLTVFDAAAGEEVIRPPLPHPLDQGDPAVLDDHGAYT